MSGLWRPLLVGAVVVVAVFLLAKARVFEPSVAASQAGAGDARAGKLVFASKCAACHGGTGQGGAGPRLIGTGLTAAEVSAQVDQGGGVMPARLVSGPDEADVVAYVVSIAKR